MPPASLALLAAVTGMASEPLATAAKALLPAVLKQQHLVVRPHRHPRHHPPLLPLLLPRTPRHPAWRLTRVTALTPIWLL
jgi:hypothetical protein